MVIASPCSGHGYKFAIGRIRAHGFERFLWPDAPDWPPTVGDALVFRFGYFDCFAADKLQRMLDCQVAGATMLNPTISLRQHGILSFCLIFFRPAGRKNIRQKERIRAVRKSDEEVQING